MVISKAQPGAQNFQLPQNSLQAKLQFFAQKLSLIFLSLFTGSLFISVTASSIFFILGILCWLFSGVYANNKLKILNYLIFGQIIFHLFIHTVHHKTFNESFGVLLKDTFKFFLPWFWATSALANSNLKEKRASVFFFIAMSLLSAIVINAENLKLVHIAKNISGPSGFQSQPFTVAGLTLLALFFSLKKLLTFSRLQNKTPFFLALGACLIQALALIALSQRSIWIALIAGLGIFAVLNYKQIGLTNLSVAVFIMGLFGFVSYFFSIKLKAKLTSFFNLKADASGFGCRIGLWKANWEEFTRSPIIGQGKAVEYWCLYEKLFHAHNIYLQQLVVGGLVGFSIWLSFIAASFFKIKQLKHNSAFVSGFIALLIHGFFENWWNDSEVISGFWYFLAFALS